MLHTRTWALPVLAARLALDKAKSRCAEGRLLCAAQDKAVQGRLVRLVCVFLQSLIKNGLINLQVRALGQLPWLCVRWGLLSTAAACTRDLCEN